ncbi:helicase C-terminal domain-containing protein, partial [Kalaharituber pfeilii]
GKSLSLLCSSLTWLRDHKAKTFEASLQEADIDETEPAWIREFALEEKKRTLLRAKIALEEQLKRIREKELLDKARSERGVQKIKRQRIAIALDEGENEDENQFLLADYDSNDEGKSGKSPLGLEGLSSETREILKKYVFYCSRTHSQLTQFVHELKRIKVPPAFPLEVNEIQEEVKHVPLGSRKNLCINPKVQKLSSITAINERCLELQQSGKSQEPKCRFLPDQDDQVVVREFRDYTLAQIRDIEELGNLGKKIGVCPYYASRATIKPSEIVTLPYPLLLQKSAREALGVSLKGHVVIIDEAHNLMDAILNIHSITVTLSQIQKCHKQTEIYLGKFGNKLNGSNKVYVMQLLKLLKGLMEFLEGKKGGGTVAQGDLLAIQGVDQVNIYKLQKYITESKLARKVEGYLDFEERKRQKVNKGLNENELTTPTLMHIQGLLSALTNPTSEGRFFHGMTDQKEIYLKYMLLDPAHYFKSIVEEARAVVLAGGTMEPMDDYRTHLFPYVAPERIRTLSCGHVIPKENLMAWSLCTGPGGRELKFTYDKRNDLDMINELGRAIINLCLVIPHGVVCFFPSYAYLDFVISRWQINNNPQSAPNISIWERLAQRKTLFTEPKNNSSVEDTLREYSQATDSGKGGLLFSVVGGKMSEGINFNDSLGRGVLMVGLPFPNSQSAEWRAKLEHVEKATGREFYENACMRAVNQSIGRAIRHQHDYAVIVLLDQRYSLPRITTKLPKWIRDSVVNGEKQPFTKLMSSTSAFFRAKTAK